jgi:predicted nucleotidyltransferase
MPAMKRDQIIATLRAHEPELKAAGIASLSLFGSIARGDDRGDSDIDVAVRLSDHSSFRGFAYFGHLDRLARQLETILGRPVDIVVEPVQKERLRREIEEDRAIAF